MFAANSISDDELVRLKKLYANKRSKNNGNFREAFKTFDEFHRWWQAQISRQNGRCYYCKTAITLIAQLIEKGLLGKRKTRGLGFRGSNLEVDRKDSNRSYEPTNCVLACYFCNNDKSYVYIVDDAEWEQTLGAARRTYFEGLARKAGIPIRSDEVASG